MGGRKHGNYAKRRGLKLFCQKLKSCSIESWNVVQSKYGILFSETYGFLYYINNNPVWISGWYFAAGKQGILSRSRVSARTGAVRYLKEQGWGMKTSERRKEYRRRIIDSTIETYLSVSGGISIDGPKGCGKTRTAAHHAGSVYPVGNPGNEHSKRKLAELQPCLVLRGDTPRLIDEWQEVPELWDAVRMEIDSRNRKGQFILTGSSTPKRKGIMHSGVGRIACLRMDTMSLYETGDSSGLISLGDICNGELEMTLTGEVSLENLAYYIVRGGWPANLAVSPEKAYLMPRLYMRTIVKNDLNRDGEESEYDPHRAQLLLNSLARNESTTVSDCSLLDDITGNDREEMSRNTLLRYLDRLSRLFLFCNQKPYSPSLRSSLRVKIAEKRHFADPAMAAALLGITQQKLMKDLNTFGFLFESLVEHDLRVYAESFEGELFHYQD